jgi:hypothetical protein
MGKRRGEWQLGIGIQHEILPRLSGEVTYNRRNYSNIVVTDEVGQGCDRFLGAVALEACQEAYRNFSSPDFDFFSVRAPVDPRLPGGGGYLIRGLSTPSRNINNPEAQTIWDLRSYYWHGIDTNFVWRGPGGLRLNGGTSTGRTADPVQRGVADRLERLPPEQPVGNAHQRLGRLHDSVGGRARQHRVPVVPRRRVQRQPERRQVAGDLGTGERRPRHGAMLLRVPGRRLLRCDAQRDEPDGQPAGQR